MRRWGRRRLLAVAVALHGIAHLASTSDLLSRMGDRRSATFLGGAWAVEDPAVLGVLAGAAAVVAAAYLATAAALWRADPGWPRLLTAVTLASVVVVVWSLWASIVGLLINVALLVVAARAALVDRAAARTTRCGRRGG